LLSLHPRRIFFLGCLSCPQRISATPVADLESG
jgi:hypothetical protein